MSDLEKSDERSGLVASSPHTGEGLVSRQREHARSPDGGRPFPEDVVASIERMRRQALHRQIGALTAKLKSETGSSNPWAVIRRKKLENKIARLERELLQGRLVLGVKA